MAEKIEETRENLRRLVVAVNRSSDYRIMCAADAYALAVLDKSAKPADSDHGGLDHNDTIRRQIEEGTL